jgi:hypothetical protein
MSSYLQLVVVGAIVWPSYFSVLLYRRLAALEKRLAEESASLNQLQQELKEVFEPLTQAVNREKDFDEVDDQILSNVPVLDLGRALATRPRPPLVRACLVRVDASEEFIRKVIGLNDTEVDFWKSKNDGRCQLLLACPIEEWTTHSVFHAGWKDKVFAVYDCDIDSQTQLILWHIEFPRDSGKSSPLRVEVMWSQNGITLWAHGGRYGEAYYEYGALDKYVFVSFPLSDRGLSEYLLPEVKESDDSEMAEDSWAYRSDPWRRDYGHEDHRGLAWHVQVTDFRSYLLERG